MLSEKKREELKALIEEEKKILNFYVRYEDEIKKISSGKEWEIEVDECLDCLNNYYRLLRG